MIYRLLKHSILLIFCGVVILYFDRICNASEVTTKSDFVLFLNQATKNHPKMNSIRMQLLAKKSIQIANKLNWTPRIELNALKPIRSWSSSTVDTSFIEANLNLVNFGGSYSRFNEGEKINEQADLDLIIEQIQFQKQAAEILFSWLEIQNRLLSQKELVTAKNELLRVARDRFKRGQLPEQEVEKVQIDLSNAEVEIRQAEVETLSLASELETYLSGATKIISWPWLGINQTHHEKKKSIGERFQYRSLELEAEIKGYQAHESLSDWLPKIDFVSRYYDKGDSNSDRWDNYVALSFPIWDRGTSFSQRRSSLYLQEAAKLDVQKFSLEEESKISTLEERSRKLKENLDQSLISAEKSRKLAKESLMRFQLGKATVNDLLLDQSRSFNAEMLAEKATKDYHLILLEKCIYADVLPAECY
jgi:outer membrane protein TolC